MRARRARTGIVVHHDGPAVRGERLLDRGREVGERERHARPAAGSRRSRSRGALRARRGSARARRAARSRSSARRPRGSRRAPGYGNAAHARRAAIDSITGLPNPSHVDGNTTRSHAAYASATRRRAADGHRHVGAFDDARRACRRSRLRPGPTIQRCTRPVGDACARGAPRGAPRRARSCVRSRATVAASRTSSSAKPNCGAGRRRGRRAPGRGRRSCGSSSRPRSRALRARAGCAG